MLSRGGREWQRDMFPWFVIVHALFPLALLAETGFAGARPGASWPIWLGLFACAEILRALSMRALGPRWTSRVIVVPGEPPVRHGIYRVMRHPNYLAVVLEFSAGA